jgi:hypothetical protein
MVPRSRHGPEFVYASLLVRSVRAFTTSERLDLIPVILLGLLLLGLVGDLNA